MKTEKWTEVVLKNIWTEKWNTVKYCKNKYFILSCYKRRQFNKIMLKIRWNIQSPSEHKTKIQVQYGQKKWKNLSRFYSFLSILYLYFRVVFWWRSIGFIKTCKLNCNVIFNMILLNWRNWHFFYIFNITFW